MLERVYTYIYVLFFLIIQLRAFGTKRESLDHTKALGIQLANKQVLFSIKALINSVFSTIQFN